MGITSSDTELELESRSRSPRSGRLPVPLHCEHETEQYTSASHTATVLSAEHEVIWLSETLMKLLHGSLCILETYFPSVFQWSSNTAFLCPSSTM